MRTRIADPESVANLPVKKISVYGFIEKECIKIALTLDNVEKHKSRLLTKFLQPDIKS